MQARIDRVEMDNFGDVAPVGDSIIWSPMAKLAIGIKRGGQLFIGGEEINL